MTCLRGEERSPMQAATPAQALVFEEHREEKWLVLEWMVVGVKIDQGKNR